QLRAHGLLRRRGHHAEVALPRLEREYAAHGLDHLAGREGRERPLHRRDELLEGEHAGDVRLGETSGHAHTRSVCHQMRFTRPRVAFFGRLAEVAGEYLRKGSQVYIEGSLRTRKWQDKQGNERYSTEIIGSDLQMLGSRGGGGAVSAPGAGAAASGGAGASAGGGAGAGASPDSEESGG